MFISIGITYFRIKTAVIMPLLFDTKERTFQGPASYNADLYTYYNNSARKEITCIRNLIEQWFEKYPDHDKDDLKSRFKAAFDGSFFELFVFTLYSEMGYTLEVHPEIKGTLKRPDYLAKRDDEFFYIEVKFLTMLSQTEQALERKKNEVLDAINKVDATNFLLKLEEITFKDNSQPSGKNIIRFLNQQVNLHSPDDYTEKLLLNGFDGMPEITYDDDRVTIKTKLLPKSSAHRGTQSRSIAAHPLVTQIGNDSEDIKASLETKATRYGDLNSPYIICLNKQSIGLDLNEINEALYGNLQFSWSTNPANRDERCEYNGKGLFGSKSNPKFTRLSGVYVTNANTANLATTAEHTFKHNPHTKYPIDFTISKSVKEILHIADDYPLKKLPNLNWDIEL